MTIKQLGGVFGRNPTFNDVTIEGTLTLEDMTSTGIDVVGPELVTNGTFDDATGWSGVAETTDNRWYVDNGQLTKGSINGTAEQISNPFVAGKSYVVQFDVVAIPNGNVFVAIGDDTHQITGGAGTKSVFLTPTSVSSSLRFYTGGAGGGGVIIDNLSVKQIALTANLDDGVIVDNLQVEGVLSGDPALKFNIGASEAMRISSGNLLIGTTVTPTSSDGNIVLANGTAPTGSATDGVILYAEDVSSSSELKVRDEAGNITTLSPHNFDLIPQGPSEDMAWSYYSERDGRQINVDMLKAIRVLEKLSGEQLVFEN